ncbi:MAG: heparinase II/III family protein [Alphaproteobacteria bacterium]|nr:heparinase II/III family protein [Alphaproteobacteria bacterium]
MFKRAVGRALTSSALRWTWSQSGERNFHVPLDDFRPADIDTVSEMAAGRYLFGGKLVDTGGVSPFSAAIDHPGWRAELHGFSWLRHFGDLQDGGLRRFARTLVLDWIGRNGRSFDPEIWAIGLTARRVLNWMRHISCLTEGASAGQKHAINRTLARQIGSLRIRAPYSAEPVDRLMMRIADLAADLCENRPTERVAQRLHALETEIGLQFDETGLHKSRSAAIQVDVVTELVTLRRALARRDQVHLGSLPARMEAMHAALSCLVLGTGELGYFNGTGQEPADLLLALQAAGGARASATGSVGGYGILRHAGAVVIADSGLVPPADFSRQAHAGALSFEFSHGPELIVGNCGPAPAELSSQSRLFRLGAAHSAPTIDYHSSAEVVRRGAQPGRLAAIGAPSELEVDSEEHVLKLTSHAWEAEFGVTLERWLTLLTGGDTLVGQDRIGAARSGITGSEIILRFHLGPGVETERVGGEDFIRLHLASGKTWSFLWEGASAEIDESVRQSAYFGFYKTRQIVLTAPLVDGREIAWILTRLT